MFSKTALRRNQAIIGRQWEAEKGRSIGKGSNPLFQWNNNRNNLYDCRLNYPCSHTVGFQGVWEYLVSSDCCKLIPVNPNCAENLGQPGSLRTFFFKQVSYPEVLSRKNAIKIQQLSRPHFIWKSGGPNLTAAQWLCFQRGICWCTYRHHQFSYMQVGIFPRSFHCMFGTKSCHFMQSWNHMN